MQKESKSARRRRETINSYLKLKTYLKYKYLLILKCDFRLLSGDPSDENEEKFGRTISSWEDQLEDFFNMTLSRITTNDLGAWWWPEFHILEYVLF